MFVFHEISPIFASLTKLLNKLVDGGKERYNY